MEVQQDEGEKIMEMWKHRVFFVMGMKLNGSGVLVNNKRILTAAHLGFTLNQVYNVIGTNQRHFFAKCCYISKKLDFAVLQSDYFEDTAFFRDLLTCGRQYFILGYPHSSDRSLPAIMNVLIESLHSDLIHYIGTPGARAGYSGGPVINKFGGFSGILLGDIHEMTNKSQEVFDGYSEQKYVRLLPFTIIEGVCSAAGSDNDS